LQRDDEGLKADLVSITDHFKGKGIDFDMIVFIPMAGVYLRDLFKGVFGNSIPLALLTIRRASTVEKVGIVKQWIFKHKWASDLMRHCEVLDRLIKLKFKRKQEMVVVPEVNTDVKGKSVLVIDDSVDTGTTMELAKSILLQRGANSVLTACITNHLSPTTVEVDYAVYQYQLLRTVNSRDYDAS